MSYFASSASPELAHWHEEQPTHLMSIDALRADIIDSTRVALSELRTFIVKEEHTIADICAELGIHTFHHNFFGNLVGTTLVLYKVGHTYHIEIRREGSRYPTSFPVQLVA